MLIQAFLVEPDSNISKLIVYNMEDILPIRFVGVAAGEREACEWLSRPVAQWNLLIVDTALQQGSGFGVLKHCLTRTPRQKVVVLTPDVTPSVVKRCSALGADAVFDKGQDVDKLVDFCLHYSRALDSSMASPSYPVLSPAGNEPFFSAPSPHFASVRRLRVPPRATPAQQPYHLTPFPTTSALSDGPAVT